MSLKIRKDPDILVSLPQIKLSPCFSIGGTMLDRTKEEKGLGMLRAVDSKMSKQGCQATECKQNSEMQH